MKHTLSFMVWAILAVLLPLQMAQAAAPPTELQHSRNSMTVSRQVTTMTWE